MIEGRMTVERVTNAGGFWNAELHVDGRWFASVNNRPTEDSLLLAANEVANRWNEHTELLALVRQLAVTEVNAMSLDCAPTAARNLFNRISESTAPEIIHYHAPHDPCNPACRPATPL